MEALKQRIQRDGKIRGNNEVLKVDSFLNHQMDVAFDHVPVVFAKKNKTKNIDGNVYLSQVESFTQGKRPYPIFVSKEFLHPGERVLLIDDFLANGSALSALIDLVHQAGAQVVGAGIVIEKAFQPGGALIRGKGVRVESLARIESMDEEDGITFCD